MIRRFGTCLIVLACALAPALPALEKMLPARDSCGCSHCCCNHAACPMPAPARADYPVTTAAITGHVAREIAPRSVRVGMVYFSAALSPAVVLRPACAVRPMASAASVPLFKEHCSFLI